MSRLSICPRGHRFEVPAEGPATCPVCALSIGKTPAGPATEAWLGGIPAPAAPEQTEMLGPPDEAAAGRKTDPATLAEGNTLAPGAGAAGLEAADGVVVPGYEILEELGRGGMGVVYKARHVELHRLVALKMVLAGAHAGTQEMARFNLEAEAVARLQHPNIVQIYEMGEHEGQAFFALEFCDGGNLAQRLDGKPLSPALAADLLEKLAGAVHYAHSHGIVHRDLKPANVLLLARGGREPPDSWLESGGSRPPLAGLVPKVTDFGLAKRLDADQGQTQSGAILGTPSYMAPEQASGKGKIVGPAADVYALGAILYELLTGRPPFVADTPLETMLKLMAEEPPLPRSLAPRVPRDLETVCLKCLAKEPKKRYATARELADDLRRFQSGEPVRARRAGVLERTGRWLRRRPATAVLLLFLLAGATGAGLRFGPSLYRQAMNQGVVTLEAPTRDVAVLLRPEGGPAVTVRTGRSVTLPAGEYAVALADGAEGLELAQERLTVTRGGRHQLEVRLTPEGPIRRLEGHTGPVHGLAVSPDGRLVLSASGWPEGDETLRLWDLRTGQEVRRFEGHKAQVMCVAFAPDGRRALSGGADGTVLVHDVATGQELSRLRGHTRTVSGISFSPDGRRILTAGHDNSVRLWDAESGAQVGLFDNHTGLVTGAVFTPDGRRAVSSSHDNTVRVWDLDSGLQVRRFQVDGQAPDGLAVSPDGRLVAASGYDRCIRVWDLTTGRLLRRLLGHTNAVPTLAFSPDGRYLVSGSADRTVKVWDVASGAELHTFVGHGDGIRAVAFAPDGFRVLSAGGGNFEKQWTRGSDFAVHVWGLPHSLPLPSELPSEPAVEVRRLEGHASGVSEARVSPDGRRLLSLGMDQTVRLWDLDSGAEYGRLAGHGTNLWASAWSADSRWILTGGDDGTMRLWDAGTGKEMVRCVGHRGRIWGVDLSPNGRWALSAGADSTLRLWDLATGGERCQFLGDKKGVRRVAFAPDGKSAASCGSDDRVVRLWDLRDVTDPGLDWRGRLGLVLGSGPLPLLAGAGLAAPGPPAEPVRVIGKEQRALEGHTAGVQCVAFSPEEGKKRLVSGGHDGTVRVWDLETGQEERRFEGHGGGIDFLTISADGRRVLAGGFDGMAICWDLDTGRELAFCAAHPHTVTCLAFAPDGGRPGASGRFISCCHQDPVIRLWQLPEAGQKTPPALPMPPQGPLPQAPGETVRFAGHANGISALAISADGRFVLTGSGVDSADGSLTSGIENEVRLWDARSGQEVRRFRGHGGIVFRVLFSADGKQALSSSGDGTVRQWDLDTGKEVRVLQAQSEVRALAWFKDGRRAVVGNRDGLVRVFDWPTGKVIGEFPKGQNAWCLALSPDERLVAVASNKEVRVGNVETLQWLQTCSGHGNNVRDLFFSADGKRLFSGSDDGTIRQWDVATGQPVGGVLTQESGIVCMAGAPDGRRAVTGAWDGAVRVWDLQEGLLLHTFTGHPLLVHATAFAPDGKHVLSGSLDRTARTWALASPPLAREGPGQVTVVAFHPRAELVVKQGGKVVVPRTARRLVELPAGDYELQLAEQADDLRLAPKWLHVTAGGKHEVQVRRVAVAPRPPEWVRILEGHGGFVRRVAFAPDGRHALSACWDGAVRLWDVTTGRELRRFEATGVRYWTGVAFAPDSRTALSVSSSDRVVRLWDLQTGQELRRFLGHTEGIWNVSFSRDGRRALSCGSDMTVRLWDVATGKELQCFQGHKASVEDAALSRDGSQVISCGYDQVLILWDVKTGQEVRRFEGHTGDVYTVVYSSDGSQVLSSGHDGTVRLWDVQTGKEVRRFEGHTGPVTTAAFSPDGRRVLSCGADRTVRLWETATAKEVCCLRGHTDGVISTAFSPDGRQALSGGGVMWGGGDDFDVRLWALPE